MRALFVNERLIAKRDIYTNKWNGKQTTNRERENTKKRGLRRISVVVVLPASIEGVHVESNGQIQGIAPELCERRVSFPTR